MRTLTAACACAIVLVSVAGATETENLGIRVLPAPGKVVIDGKFDDWDLSGGVFACGDAETQRDKYAVWFHAMYDAENLYLLARWRDETPMNNPGQTAGDYGFHGDCLQMRFITAADGPQEKVIHMTAWRGSDGKDLIDLAIGRFGAKDVKVQTIRDAKPLGAQQAFVKDADGKGYVQEIALPWKLLTKDGQALKAGDKLQLTAEPNFTIGKNGRLTIKDIFRAGVSLDRVFTFTACRVWGVATLEPKGVVALAPVRLSDAREFPVRMADGLPVVDWTGLIRNEEPPGFKAIRFSVPQDGYLSLHIKDKDGLVVRQLLNAAFYAKGEHEVKWDGLTTPIWRQPGEPVPPGQYTWEAIAHTGIGLRLRGWASNGGVPWDNGPSTNWGGDHGPPSSCATDGAQMYLGWSAAEAGRALLATDLEGNVKWSNTHGGIAGAPRVAVDGGIVYVLRETDPQGQKKVVLYRLDAKTGAYSAWEGRDTTDLEIASPDGMDVFGGKVYLSYARDNEVKVLDGKTGAEVKTFPVDEPGAIKVAGDKLAYVVSGTVTIPQQGQKPPVKSALGTKVLALDLAGGKAAAVITGLANASAVTVDKEGLIYVGVRDPDHQVKVFSAGGGSAEAKLVRTIGRPGGRAKRGPWTADGMLNISGLTIDPAGKCWVMEATNTPKRVSVWSAADGKLLKEFFGPTHYGAGGATIDPADPDVMVGEGCEWRLDPKTGRSACTGVIEHYMGGAARFCTGANGKLYLVTGPAIHDTPLYRFYERVGEGDYQPRAVVFGGKAGKKTPAAKRGDPPVVEGEEPASFWADRNGDGQRQDDELQMLPGQLNATGYIGMSMGINTDLTLYASHSEKGQIRVKVGGFTPCNAPIYDVANLEVLKLPDEMRKARGIPSLDNRLLLTGDGGGSHYDRFCCFGLPEGKLLWWYPNTFAGVHGSHNAPGPAVGLIRGCLGVVGMARLGEPVGNVWAVNTNVGEWHLLTGAGFYLARLFQGDPMLVQWPEPVPGASMDNCPPGLGGEDFGGSCVQGKDGKVYIQAGKTGIWNLEVTGLDSVKAAGAGKVEITEAELAQARQFREQYLQQAVGTRRLVIPKMTPAFTGKIDQDFKGAEIVAYKKGDDSAVRTAVAWDDRNLYLAWEVKDNTPWTNAAGSPEEMYLCGDTVDFQLGTDPNADPKRPAAVLGDLRLSIGSFKGKPTAVVYRLVAKDKAPKVFSSGVVKEYRMDSVVVLSDARIEVKPAAKSYTVEAAVPLKSLDFHPAAGTAYRGDFGVTHGDPAGQRTRLRTYWNNQKTGIVDDAVFELMMEPRNWGVLMFQ